MVRCPRAEAVRFGAAHLAGPRDRELASGLEAVMLSFMHCSTCLKLLLEQNGSSVIHVHQSTRRRSAASRV